MEKEKNETLASEIIADLMKTADKKKKLIDLINSIEKPGSIARLFLHMEKGEIWEIMKTIVLSNQKGGVGKTTTSNALAAGLNNRGYRVLAVDLDPQCNLSLSCGVDMLAAEETLYHVFKGESGVKETIIPLKLGFDLLPGGLMLSGADMDFTQTGREYMLSEALEEVAGNYDFCIIDTPPTLGVLTVNAMTAADYVIVPLTADLYALQGLTQLNGLINNIRKYCNRGLQIAGILLTKYNDRQNISKALKGSIEQAAEKLGAQVFETCIREGVAIREVQLMKSDLFTEAPKAKVTQDYNDFISELQERIDN
jgi:chromosome partitioning protein